ncbi:MAG: ribbon-helix-helix protein, CopG family, partial [Promethearchaeota archaeon]
MINISIRSKKKMVEDLDHLARLEGLDRAQIIRKIIEKGLNEEKLNIAVDLYQKGDTLEEATERADVLLWDLIDILHVRGISSKFNLEEEKLLLSNALRQNYPEISKKILEL